MYASAKRDSQEEIVKLVRLFPVTVILSLYEETEHASLTGERFRSE